MSCLSPFAPPKTPRFPPKSTRTWRPWSATPRAPSCPTPWSSVHRWRHCGRSLVANRWELVDCFVSQSFTKFQIDSMILWFLEEVLIFGSCKTNTGVQREACFMSAFIKVRAHQSIVIRLPPRSHNGSKCISPITHNIHVYFIVELGMTKVMVQHLLCTE